MKNDIIKPTNLKPNNFSQDIADETNTADVSDDSNTPTVIVAEETTLAALEAEPDSKATASNQLSAATKPPKKQTSSKKVLIPVGATLLVGAAVVAWLVLVNSADQLSTTVPTQGQAVYQSNIA